MKLKIPYQILLLLFVVLGVYYPSLFGLTNSVDDAKMLQIVLNSDHRHWFDLFLHGSRNNYYRPLLMATFFADMHLWLLEESFLHLENILLHAFNTVWIFLLARQVGNALYSNRVPHWAPFCAALLFAVHPVNTEPVNWISGRTDVLAGFFLLPAVWLLLRGLASGRSLLSCMGGVLFLCACLSKETAVFIFPAGAFFCFWVWEQRSGRYWRDGTLRLTSHYWVWIVSLLLYFFMRTAAKPVDKGVHHVVNAAGGETYAFFDGVRIFLKAAGFYVKKLFVPWPLNFAIIGASDLYVGLGVVFLVAIAIWLWRRSLLAMIFLAVACLLSSALLVPLLNMTWTPLAERYLYLPGAFFVVGLVFFFIPLAQRFSKSQAMVFVFVPLISVFTVSTYQRNVIWQDNLALYQDTNRKTPNFAPVRNELALALIKNGRVDEGQSIFLDNKIQKKGSETYYSPENHALVYWRKGQFEEAGKLFWEAAEKSRRTAPTVLKKYLKLMEGRLLKDADISDISVLRQEIQRVQVALYEKTNDPFWLYRQAKFHLAQGERDTALKLFEQASLEAPDHSFYKQPAAKFVNNLKKEQQ